MREFVVLGGNKNANLNFKVTKEGMNLLLIIAAKGEAEMLNLMLQNPGLDINITDNFGVNAFWIAAFHGHFDSLRILYRCEVEMYSTNQNGSNALHMAVKKQNYRVIKELIAMKFDVQWPKNNGVTALGIAALAGDLRAFHMLISGGADPCYTNRQGIGALYLAIKGKAQDVVQFLVKVPVPIYNKDPLKLDNSAVFFAVKVSNIDAMEIFVDISGD